MQLYIPIGWWLVPTAFTALVIAWYIAWQGNQPPASGYGSIGAGLGEALVLLLCVVVIAVAWIIYLAVALWLK